MSQYVAISPLVNREAAGALPELLVPRRPNLGVDAQARSRRMLFGHAVGLEPAFPRESRALRIVTAATKIRNFVAIRYKQSNMTQKRTSRQGTARLSERQSRAAPTANSGMTRAKTTTPLFQRLKLPENCKDVTSEQLGTKFALVGAENFRKRNKA
jgi:hypothetical protein